jgi:hypothetical protein
LIETIEFNSTGCLRFGHIQTLFLLSLYFLFKQNKNEIVENDARTVSLFLDCTYRIVAGGSYHQCCHEIRSAQWIIDKQGELITELSLEEEEKRGEIIRFFMSCNQWLDTVNLLVLSSYFFLRCVSENRTLTFSSTPKQLTSMQDVLNN